MQRTHANVEHLQEHGPATLAELPNERVSTNDRQAGVAKFDPPSGGALGVPTPVYYLLDSHDPLAIVDQWLTENADRLADTTDRVIVKNCNEVGSQFGDAAHQLLETKRTD